MKHCTGSDAEPARSEIGPYLQPATATSPVWLRAGTLFDGTSDAAFADAHVVYDSERIRFVGTDGQSPPADVLRPGQSTPDVHLPGHTLLPGLIEAHAHLFLDGGELDVDRRAALLKQSPEQLLAAAHTRLDRLVKLGVLGVRDAGDKDGVGLALSRLYRHGGDARPLMPYLDSPGAAIHHAGRYGSFMAESIEQHGSLRGSVEARVAAGADRIKLIPTGIINFKKGAVTSEPQMTTDEVRELVAAAREHGRQTFAHASGDAGIERAIDGGVDSVEHGFFVRDDQLARMRDLRIAWVPTFAPVQKQVEHAARMGWDDGIVSNLQRILDAHARSLEKAHRMGVLIVAGSDAGSYGVAHGYGFLEELELMERAGMPALAVLRAATGTSAQRLGYHEPFGRVAPGCRSRFILTAHPPLQTVANLRQPRIVIFDGNVYPVDAGVDPSGL